MNEGGVIWVLRYFDGVKNPSASNPRDCPFDGIEGDVDFEIMEVDDWATLDVHYVQRQCVYTA